MRNYIDRVMMCMMTSYSAGLPSLQFPTSSWWNLNHLTYKLHFLPALSLYLMLGGLNQIIDFVVVSFPIPWIEILGSNQLRSQVIMSLRLGILGIQCKHRLVTKQLSKLYMFEDFTLMPYIVSYICIHKVRQRNQQASLVTQSQRFGLCFGQNFPNTVEPWGKKPNMS